jgi:Tfp pilus assembly protein FimT
MIKNKHGYTIIEIFLVIMIMATLAVFVGPQFRGILGSYRLTGATNVVWGDFQKARMIAIRENNSIRVNFTSNTSYSIVRVGTNQVIFTRSLATDYPGVSVSINNNPMTFGSTGTAGFGGATIQIQNLAGTKNFTIATTGRIGNFS